MNESINPSNSSLIEIRTGRYLDQANFDREMAEVKVACLKILDFIRQHSRHNGHFRVMDSLNSFRFKHNA